MSIHTSIRMSSMHISVRMSIHMTLRMSLRMSIDMFVRVAVHMSTGTAIAMSVVVANIHRSSRHAHSSITRSRNG